MFPELIPDAKAHIPSATNGTKRIMNIIPRFYGLSFYISLSVITAGLL